MEKNFKDYISVIFIICLGFFLLIIDTEGLQKKTDKKELENIDYSKYERIYLDCVFDLEIKKPSNDTVPFHPYIVIKDAFALLLFLIIFAFFKFPLMLILILESSL